MLLRLSADPLSVVSRALSTCALVCCALVSASFVVFAVNQTSTASHHQAAAINPAGTTPSRPAPAAAHREAQPWRFVDGAARKLTAPFRSLLGTHSQWSVEIFSTLVALIVYGLGLGYLARYSRLT
jgi:hypothetical protein